MIGRLRGAPAARKAKGAARAVLSVAADVLGVAREMLRWPVRIWMGTAEALGSLILAAWRRVVLPAVRVAWRALKAGVAFGERTVTPARGLTVVALAATIILGASQFRDYRAVQVGAPDYNVNSVAQAPEVDQASPRSAHGAAVFAIAAACLFVTVFAAWRNWRLARLLFFGGLAVVAISLLADVHQGLHLGATGEAYQGTRAVLLGAFWAQLAAGATLVVVGPLLATQLRGERVSRRGRSRRRRASDDIDPKRVSALRPGVGT